MFEVIKTNYNYKAVTFIFLFIFSISVIGIYLFSTIGHKTLDIFSLLLFGLILGLIVSIITILTSKRATIKVTYKNKHEFIYDVNEILNNIGFRKSFESHNKIIYRWFRPDFIIKGNKIDIKMNYNEAYITCPKHIIKNLKKRNF